MAVIAFPMGISTIVMAFELGLVFEALNTVFLLCVFITCSLYEICELVRWYEYDRAEEEAAKLSEANQSGGGQDDIVSQG